MQKKKKAKKRRRRAKRFHLNLLSQSPVAQFACVCVFCFLYAQRELSFTLLYNTHTHTRNNKFSSVCVHKTSIKYMWKLYYLCSNQYFTRRRIAQVFFSSDVCKLSAQVRAFRSHSPSARHSLSERCALETQRREARTPQCEYLCVCVCRKFSLLPPPSLLVSLCYFATLQCTRSVQSFYVVV